MNKIILDCIYKRIKDKKTKFIASTLSYYAIISIIPTLNLSTFILKTLFSKTYINYQSILDFFDYTTFSNLFISIITLYMISKLFFILLKNHKSTIKALILSIVFLRTGWGISPCKNSAATPCFSNTVASLSTMRLVLQKIRAVWGCLISKSSKRAASFSLAATVI